MGRKWGSKGPGGGRECRVRMAAPLVVARNTATGIAICMCTHDGAVLPCCFAPFSFIVAYGRHGKEAS